ncbi:hypothetical protein J7400_07570 [Shimia sp. R9_2]|uniref:hypothetical protein n=1 Tax=Shimia sp. R9_2 TaxID=2821112 RepID=UPI001AD9C444|nr:hypothetical protein [Shimia sp. R9_2]MBO9396532.1 hypothetical protein [Shimia sp. R9_2]
MLRIYFAMLSLLVIAACGADGEPFKPRANANIGIGSDGVHTSGNVGISNGTVSISIGGGCRWYGC